ncbi:hypothetical protein SH584_03015 [Sphingomonas sp. LY29]|uniref:hypothetical protein n=1 Tax=Sphingomonas sp. LY29 TaxID=3095341 RepID=UPI002D774B67|nr:hypothetical protein [Sphingomonas sp. LY29]WRP26425.1 hypothetical protein SH584_03015 [Sphingomonas sp. LY29]
MIERQLSLSTVLILLSYSVMLAGGQVLFKLAALRYKPSGRVVDDVLAMALNPFLVAAIMLYAGLSALWVWVLTFVPLSIAYPFVALAFILAVASGPLLFGEAYSIRLAIGGALVIAGLLIITS